jgi:hypothetical protein
MRCPVCKDFAVFGLDSHTCKPAWLVKPADDGEEFAEYEQQKIYARDAEAAAEKYAEDAASEGDGDEYDLEVINFPGMDKIVRFSVTVEAVPSATAHKTSERKVTPPAEEDQAYD